MAKYVRWTTPPLGAYNDDGRPEHAVTTRAPSMRGVTWWVLAPSRAPPDARHATWVDDAVCAAERHPLGGRRHDEWPEHANHVRAGRVGRDWAGLRTTYNPSSRPGVHVLRL